MSMKDCIQRAIDTGQVDRKRGRDAQNEFDKALAKYERMPGYTRAQAEAAAASDLQEATRKGARVRFHKTVNQLAVMRKLKADLSTVADPAQVLKQLIEGHARDDYTGLSVRSLTEAYLSMINARLADFLEQHHLNIAGSATDKVAFLDIVRELHGQATGSEIAVKFAEMLTGTQRWLLQTYNRLGGNITELAHYGVAHAHSADQLVKAGFDTWRNEITPLLAWHRIEDVTTGKPFVTEAGQVPNAAAAERFLKDIYDGTVTGGWDSRLPGSGAGAPALYNRRAEHRVLHFKDADAWLSYNQKYGKHDPFTALMSGLHGMARDVALMQVLGPDPRLGLDFAIGVAKQAAARKPGTAGAKALRAAEKNGKKARTMLFHVDGRASIAEDTTMAAFFSGYRSVLASTHLGGAIFASIGDSATIRHMAKLIGLNPMNIASRTTALTLSGLSRKHAARLGYVAQTLAEAGGGSARYFGEMFGTGLPERLSGFVMRAQGLSHITDSRRIAIQLETSAELAEMADLAFADIKPDLRRMMEKRGITAADWDHLRHPDARFVAEDGSGADFITPHWFVEHQTTLPREAAEDLALKLQMAMQENLEIAMPTYSIEMRAAIVGERAPGTWGGEMARSFMMYKGYPFSFMMTQYRLFMQQPTKLDKAAFAANLFIPLLLTSAIGLQLGEIAKGNDPRPMTDAKFWMAAVLRSGGLGIFGDFFAASTSRTGGGFAEVLAGPQMGELGALYRLLFEPVNAAAEGRETNFGRALARYVGPRVPVLSTLFYTRLAFSRLVADNLQRLLDPEAESDMRRRERQRQKDFGTRMWWHLGDDEPYRGPDFSNALRSSP